MSLEKLRGLRSTWRRDPSLYNHLAESLDEIGFSADYVSSLVARVGSSSRKPKQLKDNVWGMIEFDWRSMCLVDSPLLQRLRKVHQLGLTYLTYPTAEHSRFSHSLGVAHVTSRFIQAINNRAAEYEQQPSDLQYVGFNQIPLVRPHHLIHAALLHDVGHLPYSHVSEKVLSGARTTFKVGSQSVAEFLFDVNRALGKDVPLAEALSLLVVLSERFDRFYRGLVVHDLPDTEDDTLLIACLIAGLAPAPALTALTSLISSASVDADKVDYVNRDALNCGVPVGVDVSRVFLRSGIVRASADQVRKIGLKDAALEEYIFVLNSSGMDTIDEVLLARTALFQRVYFHAVTRTAERIFGAALQESAGNPEGDPMLVDALDLWSMDDATALQLLCHSDVESAARFAQRIQLRQLPKKAYAFGPSLENLPYPIDDLVREIADDSWTELRKLANTAVEERLRDERLWGGDAARIEADIIKELEELKALLLKSHPEHVPSEGEDPGVLLVGTAHKDKRRHVQIMCQGEQLIAGKKYTNAPEQQDAFELLKEVGFVMSDRDWRSLAFFAARSVLCTLASDFLTIELMISRAPQTLTYLTRFLPEYGAAVLRSGIPAKRILALERAIRDTDYFDRKPWLAEPQSPDDPAIGSIARRLSKFSGVHGWQVTPRTAAAFVSQFPPRLRSQLLTLLEDELVVIDWGASADLLVPLLNELNGEIDVVGFTPTSGMTIQDWLRKEVGSNPRIKFPADLATALNEQTDRPLVFVDDNASSGIQASAQLLSSFGVDRADWPDDCREEKNVFAQTDGAKIERLRQRPVYLVLAVGTSAAQEKVSSTCQQMGIANFAGLRFAKELKRIAYIPTELMTYLEEVGTSVISWHKFRRPPEDLNVSELQECKADALGLGNAGGLVVTSQNAPTGTLTPLWQPGVFRGQPWMPLVIRHSRFADLVIG